ncbi:FG-GAP-like repeat-containing protein [Shewanella sp. 5_MG-2023]|uniref:FG-GAP-like repeat-containing protein n=1 Tax=Shewanella sp. 5_MG-2023 TaxID=3062656 RepID=UPI0026E32537|nr:FG-GAP-like repeat-containing protein [Shewanella sp. 5_MG-2023]MDO6641694.1 FG-GAP-like repeat-containing protein [Shewanella sp. 5_MG-2023]
MDYNKSRPNLFTLLVTITLALQACGGSDDSTGLPTDEIVNPPTSTPPQTTPTEPSLGDFVAFGPSEVVRIAEGESGFLADLDSGDRFGRDHDNAGDINGDGIDDLVVGARSDDDGATDAGAVYILFMNQDGTVKANQKISMVQGLFSDSLDEGDFFGYGVAGIGDYNGDTIPDIAVSAPAASIPAVYILHLNRDGTVKSMVKNGGIVAQGLSAIGDINEDGKIDLVAAQPSSVDGGSIQLLFFDENAEVIDDDIVTIGSNKGGFGDGLTANDSFGGRESALLGDLDNNGTQELAVGAFESDSGMGAIWVLSLDSDTYEVVDKLKIAPGLAGFDETIPLDSNPNGTAGGHFGHALVAAGDLNGDGVADLITGANQYGAGVGYVLYLNPDKSVKSYSRINETEGGFDLSLASEERFSRSMSLVDTNREQGTITVNMGGGAGVTGAIYALRFQACDFSIEAENTFWSEGNTLFSNWDHGSQTVTDALNFEQCSVKAFEYNGTNITAKVEDGRCIIKDASAVLSISDEGSQAYRRQCL